MSGVAILGTLYIVTILAALASTAVIYSLWFRNHLTATLDEQTAMARSGAALTATWLDESVNAATAASRTDAARRLDPAGLRTVLAELSLAQPRITAATVFDGAGKLVVAAGDIRPSSVPDVPIASAAAPLVQATSETRNNSGVPSALIAIPIRDEAGLVKGTLTTQVDLSGFQALIRTLPVGLGPQVSVFDRDGYVLATKNFGAVTDAERIRVRAQVFLPDVLAGREVRNAEFTGAVSGQRRIGVGVPVPDYGWAVLVSEPRSNTDAALWRSLGFVASLIVLCSVAGGIGLIWYRWHVAAPLRQLRLAMATPERDRIPLSTTGISEVASLEATAEELRYASLLRERDLDSARAQQAVARTLSDTLVANATVGLALVGWPNGRIVAANSAFTKQLSVAPGETVWDRLPNGSMGDVALLLREAATGNRPQSAIITNGATLVRWTAIPTGTSSEGGTLVLQAEALPDPT